MGNTSNNQHLFPIFGYRTFKLISSIIVGCSDTVLFVVQHAGKAFGKTSRYETRMLIWIHMLSLADTHVRLTKDVEQLVLKMIYALFCLGHTPLCLRESFIGTGCVSLTSGSLIWYSTDAIGKCGMLTLWFSFLAQHRLSSPWEPNNAFVCKGFAVKVQGTCCDWSLNMSFYNV